MSGRGQFVTLTLLQGPCYLPRTLAFTVKDDGTPVTVGRYIENAVVLDQRMQFSSSCHCVFFATLTPPNGSEDSTSTKKRPREPTGDDDDDRGACVYVIDSNSSNGTFVNRTKISSSNPQRMNNGDSIIFGGCTGKQEGDVLSADDCSSPLIVMWEFTSVARRSRCPNAADAAVVPTATPQPSQHDSGNDSFLDDLLVATALLKSKGKTKELALKMLSPSSRERFLKKELEEHEAERQLTEAAERVQATRLNFNSVSPVQKISGGESVGLDRGGQQRAALDFCSPDAKVPRALPNNKETKSAGTKSRRKAPQPSTPNAVLQETMTPLEGVTLPSSHNNNNNISETLLVEHNPALVVGRKRSQTNNAITTSQRVGASASIPTPVTHLPNDTEFAAVRMGSLTFRPSSLAHEVLDEAIRGQKAKSLATTPWVLQFSDTHIMWMMLEPSFLVSLAQVKPSKGGAKRAAKKSKLDEVDDSWLPTIKNAPRVSRMMIPYTSIAQVRFSAPVLDDAVPQRCRDVSVGVLLFELKPQCRIPFLPEGLYPQPAAHRKDESNNGCWWVSFETHSVSNVVESFQSYYRHRYSKTPACTVMTGDDELLRTPQ